MLRVSLILLALLGLVGMAYADDDDDGLLKRVENKLVIQRDEPPAEPEDAPPPPPRPAPRKPSRPSYTPPPPPPPAPEEPTYSQAGDDDHFIQPDDYFVQKHGLDKHSWIWVNLSKMVSPPSAGTKDEGEFMQIKSGQNLWTRHYWRTRPATQADLRIGMHAIMFNDNRHDNVYAAPRSKENARGGSWFYAKITDMSDMYKGYVTVSGNYKVSLKNLRVILGQPAAARGQLR